MLKKFRQAKTPEITMLQKMQKEGTLPPPCTRERPSLIAALRHSPYLPVIAEYKRASPSRGVLNKTLSPEKVAMDYASAGASAISVLTEEKYFEGDISFLSRAAVAKLPLLRKDFIFHPLQLEQTAATPASAILLIARLLSDRELKLFLDKSRYFNLEVVTEIFDRADLATARNAGAEIIQVNNRDLDTLEVSLENSKKLIPFKKDNEFWITASGINSPEQLEKLLWLGFDAALVGSSLMERGTPERALRQLLRNNTNEKNSL